MAAAAASASVHLAVADARHAAKLPLASLAVAILVVAEAEPEVISASRLDTTMELTECTALSKVVPAARAAVTSKHHKSLAKQCRRLLWLESPVRFL
jgi:citrate lyase synthetase